MDICAIIFFIVFISFLAVIAWLVLWTKKKDRDDSKRRAQDSQITRKVLSDISNEIPGLVKRAIGEGTGHPAMLIPYYYLIGKYNGKMTYVTITFDNSGAPRALGIDMVHRARIPDRLNLNFHYTGSNATATQAREIVERTKADLMGVKDEVGDFDEVIMNDVMLLLRARMVKTEKGLKRVLEIMSAMCDMAERSYGSLSTNDIPLLRDLPLFGKGLLRFEDGTMVYVDPLQKATSYRYDDIMTMTVEEIEYSDSIDDSLCISFKDGVKVAFDRMSKPLDRVGTRTFILGKLGLLRATEETKEQGP